MGATLHPDLRAHLAAVPLVRDVVSVRGDDAVSYLQGQLSQDLDALPVGSTTSALLLQPTGKMVAWVRVTRMGDEELLLDVDSGAGEVVHARLRRFLLRTRAELHASTWSGIAVRGPGAASVALDVAPGVLRVPAQWPGVEGTDLLAPGGVAHELAEGLAVAPVSALDALRIECGVPAFGTEVTEDTIPAELGQWLIDSSVSFTKGCYAGQELVARVDSRGGNVPRPLRGLLLDGEAAPTPGAAVLVDGNEVGTVTSAAVSAALGPVGLARLRRSVAPGTRVEVASGTGAVAELPLR